MTTTTQPMSAHEREDIEQRWVKKNQDATYEQGCADVQRCLQEVDRLKQEAGEAVP